MYRNTWNKVCQRILFTLFSLFLNSTLRYMNFMFDLEDASDDGAIDASEFAIVCSSYGLDRKECEDAFAKMSQVLYAWDFELSRIFPSKSESFCWIEIHYSSVGNLRKLLTETLCEWIIIIFCIHENLNKGIFRWISRSEIYVWNSLFTS